MFKNQNKKSHALALLSAALLVCGSLLVGCASGTDSSGAAASPASSAEADLSDSTAINASEEDVYQIITPAEEETGTDNQKEDKKESSASDIPEANAIDGLATPATSGKLQVKNGTLSDKKGNPVQLHGISTHGLAWYPQYVCQETFSYLRNDWNVNVIRLALYTAEYGGYCEGGDQKALRRLIDDGVTYATNADQYVIIDWHILSDGNPNKYLDEAKKFFKDVSDAYADHDNVIYEICNEPNGSCSWSDIKSYAETIIPIIRKNDSDAVILVGTPTWSQEIDKAVKDPLDYDNIMYTMHFYATTHRESLRNLMTDAASKNFPIFVSEFGICEASGNGGTDEVSANAWIDAMNEYNISYCMWALANKDETAALLLSKCNTLSGWDQNDMGISGRWLYKTLTGKDASTLLKPDKPAEEPVGGKPAITGPDDLTGGSDGSTSDSATGNSGMPDSVKERLNNAIATYKGKDGDIEYILALVNTWGDTSTTNYQYELIVTNASSSAVSSWSIRIPFTDSVSVEQGWCAGYSASGKNLTISNEGFNGSLEAGSSTYDIGFIISGKDTLKPQT